MKALIAGIIKADFGFWRAFPRHGRGLSGERPKVASGQKSCQFLQVLIPHHFTVQRFSIPKLEGSV